MKHSVRVFPVGLSGLLFPYLSVWAADTHILIALINQLPDDKILVRCKSKQIADDILKFHIVRFFLVGLLSIFPLCLYGPLNAYTDSIN